METKRATLIIVGGGVTGLTLANMLEKASIDFILLEKGSEIAPNLGASMIIGASGGRILHQLGCHALIDAHMPPQERVRRVLMRSKAGKKLVEVEDLDEELIKRSGYGFIPLDRRTLVQSLYENLRDKSKVHVSQQISAIEHVLDQVRVHTTSGSVFTGDLIVGADGIHSTVRREMWRIASSKGPGDFQLSELTDTPTNYCCIFGVSKPISHADLQCINFTLESSYSWVVLPGPKKRIYWLLFSKLPKRIDGLYEKLPRYSSEDRDQLAAEHFEDHVADGLSFKRLWDARETATLTPLPSFVLSKWHYGRIAVVGDAAHKFNPMGGQGANSAIETCAALANLLCQWKRSSPKGSNISQLEATEVFERMQALRKDRVTAIMKLSNLMQTLMASDGPALRGLLDVLPSAVAARSLVAVLDNLTKSTIQLEIPGVLPAPGILRSRQSPIPSPGRGTWHSASMVALLLLGGLLLAWRGFLNHTPSN